MKKTIPIIYKTIEIISIEINSHLYPLPSNIFCVSNSVFKVKYFKKSKSSDNFINKLITKKKSGIPAPKVKEFLEELHIQEEQKQIELIAN